MFLSIFIEPKDIGGLTEDSEDAPILPTAPRERLIYET